MPSAAVIQSEAAVVRPWTEGPFAEDHPRPRKADPGEDTMPNAGGVGDELREGKKIAHPLRC